MVASFLLFSILPHVPWTLTLPGFSYPRLAPWNTSRSSNSMTIARFPIRCRQRLSPVPYVVRMFPRTNLDSGTPGATHESSSPGPAGNTSKCRN